MIKLYGIKNCDTVRKARKWLETRGVAFLFHDFRDDGLPLQTIHRWLELAGQDTLLNKRSTTWKNLDAAVRANLTAEQLPALLQDNPTLIKRPVLEHSGGIVVGFDATTYSDITT